MPLTAKGTKLLKSFRKDYGAKVGTSRFWASVNTKKVKGVESEKASR